MMHPLRLHYDKLLLMLAIAVLGGSLEWVRRQPSGRLPPRAESDRRPLSVAAYAPAVRVEPAGGPGSWSAPRAQIRGAGWLYEVFTPPVFRFDASAGTFGLKSTETGDGEATVKTPAWELLEVKPGEFRLQLAGYFGSPDDYLVAFLCPQSGETRLARVGQRFADLGLTFQSFAVRKVPVTEAEPGSLHDVAAFAVLRDERDGQMVVLDSRRRRFTEDPVAVLREHGSVDRRVLREGDTFAEADGVSQIERIQLEPAEVVVSHAPAGVPVPQAYVLRPVTRMASPGPPPAAGPQPGTDRVAVNAP